MSQLDAATVVHRLGLGDDHRAWLAELEAAGPSPSPVLPTPGEVSVLFERLSIAQADAADLIRAWPLSDRTPEIWWLLERCRRCIVADLGGTSELPPWPALPRNLGALGRLFYAYVFLAAVPDIRRWHQQRDIPDDVSWATLADLGRHLAVYRRLHGVGGLDPPGWLRPHFRGALYQLGRLQFCRSQIPYEPAMLERLAVPFRHGDPALDLHIPEQSPLTSAACDRSLHWARGFFQRHFPEERYGVAICTSWLLDDQLATYLEPDSNIVRFQRRFSLLPNSVDGDADVLMFVFRRAVPVLNELPQRTSLERAVVSHLQAGHHWKVRSGWLDLGLRRLTDG
jgi:GNAT-like C-terminal domain/N-acyltransferase N-terminal domain